MVRPILNIVTGCIAIMMIKMIDFTSRRTREDQLFMRRHSTEANDYLTYPTFHLTSGVAIQLNPKD
jgi:hypothetical protein